MDNMDNVDIVRQLLLRRLLAGGEPHESQEALVDALIEDGALRTESVIAAFKAVDRGFFLKRDGEDEDGDPQFTPYLDAPIKIGRMHQSAPSVYGKVVEALELRPGLSFLNIGSGTGYLSAIVAQLIGPNAVNIGLERHQELVQHAQCKCDALHLNVQFYTGNCYSVDVERSMKFDRVYIGAGAARDARFLYKLLKYDGIVVGPLEDDEGVQSLTKARCRGGKKYAVTQLLQVTFANLIKPGEDGVADASDLRTVSFQGPTWDVSRREVFPPSFISKVMLLYWMSHLEGSLLSKLPWELWTKFVIPMLPHDSFEPPPEIVCCAFCSGDEPKMQCSRCKKVFYCDRDCQRSHWANHKAVCVSAPA